MKQIKQFDEVVQVAQLCTLHQMIRGINGLIPVFETVDESACDDCVAEATE